MPVANPTLPEYTIPEDLKLILLENSETNSEIISEKSKEFLEVLKKLQDIDRLELTEDNYLQLLKLALYVEEFHQRKELEKFNLLEKKIELIAKVRHEYKISLENLDKEHPVTKACGFLEVFTSGDNVEKKHKFKVKIVSDTYIVITAPSEYVF